MTEFDRGPKDALVGLGLKKADSGCELVRDCLFLIDAWICTKLFSMLCFR